MEGVNLLIGIDDDIMRRDSLHATINSLPDPNYATLRALTLVRMIIHIYNYILLAFEITRAIASPSRPRTFGKYSHECS